MKIPRCVALTLHLLALLPLVTVAQTTTVTNTTFGPTQNAIVSGPTQVATSGAVTVSSGADVTFRATSVITLSSGFTAASGSVFRAFVFVDADADGMDDAWETAHNLSPGNPGDATVDTDGDGVPNVVEYQLGTNPLVANTLSPISNPTDPGNITALKIHKPN